MLCQSRVATDCGGTVAHDRDRDNHGRDHGQCSAAAAPAAHHPDPVHTEPLSPMGPRSQAGPAQPVGPSLGQVQPSSA